MPNNFAGSHKTVNTETSILQTISLSQQETQLAQWFWHYPTTSSDSMMASLLICLVHTCPLDTGATALLHLMQGMLQPLHPCLKSSRVDKTSSNINK